MFCGQCGKQNPDGGKFCTACGSKLQQIPSPGSPAAQVGHIATGETDQVEWWNTHFRGSIKAFASCGTMLFAAICFSLTVILTMAQSYDLELLYLLNWLMQIPGLKMLSGLLVGIEGLILLSMLPSILIAISLWITYASGFGKPEIKLNSIKHSRPGSVWR